MPTETVTSRNQSLDVLRRTGTPHAIITALLIFLALVHVGSFFSSGPFKALDFAAFYRAGRLVNTGHINSLYDKSAQVSTFHLPTNDDQLGMGYFYHPAFEVKLFMPFSLSSYKAGFAWWSLATVLLMLISGWLLRREFPGMSQHPLLLMLAFFPTLALVWIGQDSAWVLLLVVLAYRAFVRGDDRLCGLFVGLALFKFQYAIPLIVLLAFRRKWRLVASFAASAAALLFICWLMIGTEGLLSYWRILHDHGYEHSTRMINIRGLVDIFHGPSFVTIALSVALVVWFGLRKLPDREYFAGAVAIALLVSYHGQNYDAVLLLLPLMAAFSHGEKWPALFFVTPLYLILAQQGVLAVIALPIALLAWRLSTIARTISTPQFVPAGVLQGQ